MRSQQDQAPYRQVDRAEWNQVMREETELQSVDRHFNELLQELRSPRPASRSCSPSSWAWPSPPASPTSPAASRPST